MSDEQIRRKLFRASPAGRLEQHLANLDALGDGGDSLRYRQWVEMAADRIGQGRSFEALHFLARADLALAEIAHDQDPDRLRGVKQRGNQYHPTGPTPDTMEILEQMRPLIASGLSQAAAGRIVAARGLGASGGANKRLWTKWAKETGD